MSKNKKKVSREPDHPYHPLAAEFRRGCPECGSKNIAFGWGEGLSKMKPVAECQDCKQLLAWG